MTEHVTLKALRSLDKADAEARWNLAAAQMNLVLRAARLAGRTEVTAADMRTFDLMTQTLDDLAGSPVPEPGQARIEGHEVVLTVEPLDVADIMEG